MNKKKSCKTTIRPKGAGVGLHNILAWEPSEDASDQIYRATVPLAARKKGHKINPLANEEAKIQSLAYMGSSATTYSAVGGNETMDIYAFDYWQYIDSLVYWDGLIPTPDVIDSGHRNGVPVFGTLFFNWSTSEGDRETVRKFLQQDEDGNYLVANKLVDIAQYFGFDGYFINQETSMPSGEGYGDAFRAFMLYLKDYAEKVKYPINLSWYDSVDNDGHRFHYDAVNEDNDIFLKPSESEEVPANEFFMNFNWGDEHVNKTVEHMKKIGRSPYDAYAGLELQANGYYHTDQKRHALLDENGQTKLSLAMFVPDTVLGISDDGEDYHVEADKFWTGFGGNPAREVDNHDWSGMSRFVTDKTPLINRNFHTHFNAGHGKNWFVDGEISSNKAWNSRGIQDVMPTWRWWVENKNASIASRYDFDDAFNGGTSLTFEGQMKEDSTSDMMLYSTEIKVSEQSQLKITTKGTNVTNLQIGLSTSSDYSEASFVYYDLDAYSDWETQNVGLENLVGKTIYAIKLRVQADANLSNLKLNVGQLSIYDQEVLIDAPKNVAVHESLLFNAQSAEAMINIDPVEGADRYEVYQLNNGKWEYINASSSNYIYLANISRPDDAVGTEQELKVFAVGKNGLRSEAKVFHFDWKMEVSDTTLPKEEPENIMLDATITSLIDPGNTEGPANILNGTISGTADKWYSSKRQEHVDVEFSETRTVVRWVVEHAGAGGESADNGMMNTKDFNLEYKDAETGEWKIAKEIRDNIAHVTDILFEDPITAKEWRLNILTADNGSPWGGIRVYNWKMYESAHSESENLPMATARSINTVDNHYSFALTNGIENSNVYVYSDRQAQNKIAKALVNVDGNAVFHQIELEETSGLVYYRAEQDGLELSNILAIPYNQIERNIVAVDLNDAGIIEINQSQPLDLSRLNLTVTYSDGSNEIVPLNDMLVDVTAYKEEEEGEQVLPISYGGIESNTPLTINHAPIDFATKLISHIELIKAPKQRYLQGESLDLTGGLVAIHYADDIRYEASLSDFEFFQISGFDASQIGEQIITISHRDHEISYQVIVDKEAVNFQRLQQLVGQFESIKHHEGYDQLNTDDKQSIDEFITFGHEKIDDESVTQEEIDQIVDENTKVLQDLQDKLAE